MGAKQESAHTPREELGVAELATHRILDLRSFQDMHGNGRQLLGTLRHLQVGRGLQHPQHNPSQELLRVGQSSVIHTNRCLQQKQLRFQRKL
eukprot:scaffold8262_cov267-Pinguiococcus_pyrenoidosus.AAC.2